MFVGARVAYIIRGQGRLGVVTSFNEGDDSAVLTLDNGTQATVPVEKLTLVTNWRDVNSYLIYDKLKRLPDNTQPLAIFLNKKAIDFGVAAMRACWHWGNVNVFHNALNPPIFKITKNRGASGKYIFNSRKKQNIMQASTLSNQSIRALFETVLHEMIHQYNFEVDLKQGNYNPQIEGSHGAIFLHWVPIIESIAKVKITITHSANNEDVEYVSEDNKEADHAELEIVSPFYFACFKFPSGWLGFWFLNQDILDEFHLNFMETNWTQEPSRLYAGITNLKKVREIFHFSKHGQINTRSKTYVSPELIKLLSKRAKLIPNYQLPPSK